MDAPQEDCAKWEKIKASHPQQNTCGAHRAKLSVANNLRGHQTARRVREALAAGGLAPGAQRSRGLCKRLAGPPSPPSPASRLPTHTTDLSPGLGYMPGPQLFPCLWRPAAPDRSGGQGSLPGGRPTGLSPSPTLHGGAVARGAVALCPPPLSAVKAARSAAIPKADEQKPRRRASQISWKDLFLSHVRQRPGPATFRFPLLSYLDSGGDGTRHRGRGSLTHMLCRAGAPQPTPLVLLPRAGSLYSSIIHSSPHTQAPRGQPGRITPGPARGNPGDTGSGSPGAGN